MRENIFNLLQNQKIDLEREYIRIYNLFEKRSFVYLYNYNTMCEIIDNKCFKEWPYRKRCLNINDLKNTLEINEYNMTHNLTINKLLTYIEFIVNLIYFSLTRICSIEYNNIKDIIFENITDLLDDMNYKIHVINDTQCIIIEKDNLTTAIAETNSEITNSVIEYRRFSLKGDIDSKCSILKDLANKIEPLEKKFKSTEFNSFMDDIGTLLNNLNIRHNNIEGKYKKQYIVDMKPEELEEWYDRIYDMILVALLIDKYIDDKSKIKELKQHLN